jgi:predicted AlkP superfamily phosphohydrolase/phosphomutase
MGRIVVIGIDSATLDLIEPYVAAGHLPHIARLLQGGVYAPMRSTLPVMSPPAWTSMISGHNPGKHGIYDFLRFIPGTYRIQATRSDQTTYRTIFDLASQYNRRVLSINVPLTYPPRPVNGTMISGPIVPSRGIFTHPAELGQQLAAMDYRQEVDMKYTRGEDAAYLAEVRNVTSSQVQTFLWLMQRDPWDIAMVVLRGVDEVMGFMWHHIDPQHPWHDPVAAQEFGSAMVEIHTLIDHAVGAIIAAAGPDTTVALVSDHGGGPCYKEVFLNIWLEQKGWLVRKRHHPLDKWRRNIQHKTGLTRDHIAPRLDTPWAWAIRKRIPLSIQHMLVPEQQSPTLSDSVDWSRTRAYSIGNIGQIYLNLKGREAQGIVDPGHERDALLNQITHELFQLTDEGVPVVDEVYRSEDLYHGPYADKGPDLNILMRGMTYITQSWREMTGQQLFAPPGSYSGTHRLHGLMALYGPHIVPLGRRPEVQITDIAPTLMWLLGLPIPDDLDGSLLTSFIAPEALTANPPTYVDAAETPTPQIQSQGWNDEAEEQEVLDRLRDLGYLE